jgi:hypothetical protein
MIVTFQAGLEEQAEEALKERATLELSNAMTPFEKKLADKAKHKKEKKAARKEKIAGEVRDKEEERKQSVKESKKNKKKKDKKRGRDDEDGEGESDNEKHRKRQELELLVLDDKKVVLFLFCCAIFVTITKGCNCGRSCGYC